MVDQLILHESVILNYARNHPVINTYARNRCRAIVAAAKAVYRNRAKGENRLSETSPPRYLGSFRISGGRGKWVVENYDPGSVWVEFGAHAGGVTPVLKYRPMGQAIYAVASELDG